MYDPYFIFYSDLIPSLDIVPLLDIVIGFQKSFNKLREAYDVRQGLKEAAR